MTETMTNGIDERVQTVECTGDTLRVGLIDGREIAVPLAWYPRLLHATPEQRADWKIAGAGYGIHWPEIDEDLSVEGLLAGRRSGESGRSFQRWLATQQTRS